ncbi:hypothetical protein MUP77_09815 [Candidatus Bathyarchaeota archaeon]|nr:hypothetical protein [Candidatus Bathyarchaeota archaeon]
MEGLNRKLVFDVTVYFYTDLDHLPFEILDAISKGLEKETSNRILARIKERVNSNIRIREEERRKVKEL